MSSLARPLLATLLLSLALRLSAEGPSPEPRGPIESGRTWIADRTGGLTLSAFADWTTNYDEVGSKRFRFGAGELDLSWKLGELWEIATATLWTHEDTVWPVYFLDWHPFGGGTVAPRGAHWAEKGFHIQAGRFDVPFGNDWQFFASKDSHSISRPLTTDLIMEGGYNDRGLRLLGNNGTVNFNAYALRGLEDGRLYGGRIGFTPFGSPFSLKETRDPKTLELGLSALVHRAPGGREAQRAFAVDLEAHVGGCAVVAELIGRRWHPQEAEATWQRGWHVTPQYALGDGWPTVFLRYERVWGSTPDPVNPEDGRHTVRFCTGFSTAIRETVQAKVEFQRSLRSSPALVEDPKFRGNRVLVSLVLVL